MAGSAVSVLDLITEVLSLYGEYAPGESIDAAAAQGLLFTLNGALDGMGGEPLSIYSNGVLTFNTIAGKQAYTLGPDPSNDWVTAGAAPASLPRLGLLASSLEIPISLVSASEWAGYGLKTMQSSIATAAWIQYAPAAHTLNFWPVPSVAYAVKVYTAQPVPAFAALSDSVILPPGYQEFLTYDLCIKSAAKFGAAVPEWVPAAWREARTRIKERNYRGIESRLDPALSRASGRGWPSIKFYTGGN